MIKHKFLKVFKIKDKILVGKIHKFLKTKLSFGWILLERHKNNGGKTEWYGRKGRSVKTIK